MTFRPRTPPPPLEHWMTLRFAALFALQPLLGLLRLLGAFLQLVLRRALL